MDAQIKAKWVEALRSGKYGQTRGMLHDPDGGGFCCLGVLCKVMGAEFGEAIEEDDGMCRTHDYVPQLNGRVLGADEELTSSFCKEVGIPDQFELIKLNDGYEHSGIREHSFVEIADYIEQNL